MTSEHQPSPPFAIRDFRYYWLARSLAILAQMALVVVIGWQVYDLARQTMGLKAAAFQLGLVGLAQFAPLLAFGLYAGWIADRYDRRRVAQFAILLEIACAKAAIPLTLRRHAGYDHSYYFVSSFVEDHLRWFARSL